MAGKIFLVRHGDHQDNVLTPEGVKQVRKAAMAIKADGVSEDTVLVTSQIPRAFQSGGFVAADLKLNLIHAPMANLNPAEGLGANLNGKLPAWGEGACVAWREGCDGVEEFDVVKGRVWHGLVQFSHGIDLVVVCHGGVIEPATDGLKGADLHDLAPGEVVVIEEDSVRFLNSASPSDTDADEPEDGIDNDIDGTIDEMIDGNGRPI